MCTDLDPPNRQPPVKSLSAFFFRAVDTHTLLPREVERHADMIDKLTAEERSR